MLDKGILLVSDDAYMLQDLSDILKGAGYSKIQAVCSKAEAFTICKESNYDLLIIKAKLVDGSGLELFESFSGKLLNGVLIVEDKDFPKTILTVKNNNCFFLRESFHKEELLSILDKIKNSNTERENKANAQSNEVKKLPGFKNFIGDSEVMRRIFDLVVRIADTDATVLISGDSGTGKEVIARTLHYSSHRKNEPFIPVNCGAIPSGLLESELFGHTRGAFTGAVAKKDGRFKLANKGTLFLDEIGLMSPDLQAKLLRVLQTKSFDPIGSLQSVKMDTRIIAATNIDMEQAMIEKRFREDLFYRLNVIPIYIPSLKERRGDIPLLVQHFLDIFNREKNYDVHISDESVMNVLMKHDWPGNVRELENIIHRLVILKKKGKICLDDLPSKLLMNSKMDVYQDCEFLNFKLPEDGVSLKHLVAKFENSLLQQALKRTNGNKNRASALLKMNRTTLVEKLKRNNLR